jgi:histidine triad (HIT) family protein
LTEKIISGMIIGMNSCLFCQIINKQISAKITYEDDLAIAFADIHPQAPIHQLIIPREHIATINNLLPKHNVLIGHLFQIAKKLAQQYQIDQSGYRVLFNCNQHAGQAVYHIHLHLLGGRMFNWPPG